MFFLRLLLLHTSLRSFEDARTVDGTVYDNFQLACHALGLLTNETESELCFNEAREANYFPAQLRSLLVILIMDGAPAVQILEANADILMADFVESPTVPVHQAHNSCLQEIIATRLEALGRTMSDFGLPEPARGRTEVEQELLHWNQQDCQQFVDEHLPLLTRDEQRAVFDEVLDAVQYKRPLLMYIDLSSGQGKTLLIMVSTAALRAQGKIVLCSATTGLAALNYKGGTTAHSMYKIPITADDEVPKCNVSFNS